MPQWLLLATERVLRGLEELHALGHLAIVDDTYVAQIAEVGGQFHLQTVRHAVGRVVDTLHASHEHAFGEYRGVAARDDDIADAEPRLSLIHI